MTFTLLHMFSNTCRLADLRTDMQVDAYDPDVFERFDLLGMLKHLFI